MLVTSCNGGGGGGDTKTAVPPLGPFMTRQEASQFLLRATFGPTDESIDRIVSIGYEA